MGAVYHASDIFVCSTVVTNNKSFIFKVGA
jgi:hypothetical protein